MKESGLGREHSLEGMLESYTDLKSVIVNLTSGCDERGTARCL
jgi:hypothetical protein